MRKLYGCRYAPFLSFTDPLSMIGSIFWRWAVPDRFGILNEGSPYNFKAIDKKPLPKGVTPKETMEELIAIKANELVKQYSDKEIVVFWSGGVDSTCIICALLMAGISKEQLVIVYTKESIAENPNFYNWLIASGYRMVKFPWGMTTQILNKYPNSILINGWCADQLFGSNVNQKYHDLYTVDFRKGLKHILKQVHKLSNVSDSLINVNIEKFNDYANQIGLPIKYTCEALWLFNFGVKWSHVSMDMQMRLPNDKQRNNVVVFFEDIRFQEWSVANYQNFYKNNQATDIANYKKPLKNVIFKFNKDEDYYINKGKVNSWAPSGHSSYYYELCILDNEGYHRYDLQQTTEATKDCLSSYFLQEKNRRWYLKDYLKDGVDVERFLTMEKR